MNNKKPTNKKNGAWLGAKHTGSYHCQICQKQTANSVDAVTHLLDHGTSALEAVNALIKDQKIGRVSTQDRTDDDNGRMASHNAEGDRKTNRMVAQEA